MTDIDEKYETPARRVISFLANELAVPPDTIDLTSRLREDLGMSEADAANIIEAYSLVFDIDITDFRINDYFGPDTGLPRWLSWLLWVFGNGKPQKTITVADLARAFETGTLK